MNRPVRGAASEPAVEPPLRQPDLFDRAIWLVQEIGGAIVKLGVEAPNLVARIRVARTTRNLDVLHEASRDLGVLLASAAILTKTLEEQAKRGLPAEARP